METTRADVDKEIDRFVEGNLGHATEMFSVLWEIMNEDDVGEAPPNIPHSVSPGQLFLLGVTRKCLLHKMRPKRSRAPPIGLL